MSIRPLDVSASEVITSAYAFIPSLSDFVVSDFSASSETASLSTSRMPAADVWPAAACSESKAAAAVNHSKFFIKYFFNVVLFLTGGPTGRLSGPWPARLSSPVYSAPSSSVWSSPAPSPATSEPNFATLALPRAWRSTPHASLTASIRALYFIRRMS